MRACGRHRGIAGAPVAHSLVLRNSKRTARAWPPQGVRVGEHWKDRLDCRQWGAHFPHVAGIAGQSGQGAQSVVLSGGRAPRSLRV